MNERSADKPRGALLKPALGRMSLIGVAVAVTIIGLASCKPAGGPVDLKTLAKGDMEKLTFESAGMAAPGTVFYDAAGKAVTLADFKGKVVVLNFWATWCGPCKIEMPTVAKLAKAYEGTDVVVLPVSVDKETEEAKAQAFIAGHPPLDFYVTRKLALNYAFRPPAKDMPTTIIFGRDGVEKARLIWPADWSGEDAKALVEAVRKAG